MKYRHTEMQAFNKNNRLQSTVQLHKQKQMLDVLIL